MHPPGGYRIKARVVAPCGLITTCMIDAYFLIGFHALAGPGDETVRAVDDVGRRAVVLDQMVAPGLIVSLELADVANAGAAEGIDVLVVVAHHQQGELVFLAVEGRPASALIRS